MHTVETTTLSAESGRMELEVNGRYLGAFTLEDGSINLMYIYQNQASVFPLSSVDDHYKMLRYVIKSIEKVFLELLLNN